MTFGALLGVTAALGLVLALFGLAFGALRRGALPVPGAARLPLELLGRVPLGPRQGLAAVRLGDRVLLVAVGEGGVRRVGEASAVEWEQAQAAAKQRAMRPQAHGASGWERLRGTLRGLMLAVLVAAPLLALAADPAVAQQAGSLPAAGAAQAAVSLSQPAGGASPSQLSLSLGGAGTSGMQISGTVGTVVVIGLLTLLPTMLLLTTSFTRILIVLHFLRQALGTQTTPPTHLLAALALLLTGFVMAPTLGRVNEVALAPWLEGRLTEGEMLKAGVAPLREFMLEQTPEDDLAAFVQMSGAAAPESVEQIPLPVLLSAFATSELRTAFQMGFALFLPFLVIDLVVASVLTSMGMFMLPPMMISLPCKLLLFVLVDGWSLVVQSLVSSFH